MCSRPNVKVSTILNVWKKGKTKQIIFNFTHILSLLTVAEIPGVPEPKIKWFHNDKQLKEGPHYHLYEEEGIYTLEIDGTTEKDRGTYTAEITNQYGSISTSCKLDVNGEFVY